MRVESCDGVRLDLLTAHTNIQAVEVKVVYASRGVNCHSGSGVADCLSDR